MRCEFWPRFKFGKTKVSISSILLANKTLTSTGQVEPRYQGTCNGTVSCRAFSKAPLRITNGTVEFFTPIAERAEASAITYHLDLLSVEGARYHLEGQKVIDSNIAFSVKKMWQETTTVNVNVLRHDGTKVGSGVLHISLPDFKKQIRTFRTTEPFNKTLLLSLISFLIFFLFQVSYFFFRPFVPIRHPRDSTGKNIKPKHPVSSSCKIKARDGVQTILDVYGPLPLQDETESVDNMSRPPILFLPGITITDPFFICTHCHSCTATWLSISPSVGIAAMY